jgi:hypothetical protein
MHAGECREERSNADTLPSGVSDHVQSKEESALIVKLLLNGDAFTEEKLDSDNGLDNVSHTEELKSGSRNSTSSQKLKGNNRSHNEKTKVSTKSAIEEELLKKFLETISSSSSPLCKGITALHLCLLRALKYRGDLSEVFEAIMGSSGNLNKLSRKVLPKGSLDYSLQQLKDLLTKVVSNLFETIRFLEQLGQSRERARTNDGRSILHTPTLTPSVVQEMFNIWVKTLIFRYVSPLLSTKKLLPWIRTCYFKYQERCFLHTEFSDLRKGQLVSIWIGMVQALNIVNATL